MLSSTLLDSDYGMHRIADPRSRSSIELANGKIQPKEYFSEICSGTNECEKLHQVKSMTSVARCFPFRLITRARFEDGKAGGSVLADRLRIDA